MASRSDSSRDCSHIIDHDHVPQFEVATWIKITLFLVYLVIFVVGILGNSITIRVTQVLQKKGYLQKEVTDHMVSLACSDILVFLIGMPMEFYSIIWNPLTTPSYALSCKLHTFLFEACSYATLLHVLTLSFERYIAICHPFRYKAMSGPCQVKLLIAFVWVTSALVALPLLFAMGIEYPLVHVPAHRGLICNRSRTRHREQPEASNMSICTNLSSRWTVFQSSIFGAFVLYLLVLLSVAFMCWNMMQVLMRSKQGTMAGTGQQVQLRKSESEESRAARRQTIIFLSEAYCCDISRLLDAKPDSQDHGCSPAQARLDQVLLPGVHDPAPVLRHLLLPQLGGKPAPVQRVLAAVPQGVLAGAALPPDAAPRQPGETPARPPQLQHRQRALRPQPAHLLRVPAQFLRKEN
ncbi:PREDICTED: G-protein coupled receptor 39 isoform X2 [Chinchilla lanigera]|uniref:G-protein coupled receptor 39 isoform X2 n=1 Tax=Chinchilla lanigera TaxID=34839 RepID=UPI00038ECBB3|nr:PREDICTED: G-protein coupled receptor 39 isoform X2 [Chinchilla lanigera]